MTGPQLHKFRDHLLHWFENNQRKLPWRQTNNPYRLWVAEVMLQQTQVKTVLKYYDRFIKKFPDVHALANAEPQEVLKTWEGLGYYARARNLHKAVQLLVKDNEGKIPDNYSEFRKLPGAGDYITAAVLSQAFGAQHAVVDGNVKRILSRLFLIEERIDSSAAQKTFNTWMHLLLDPEQPGQFNQAMMELGAIICRPKNPKCDHCPVVSFCAGYQTNQWINFPKTRGAKNTPEFQIAVGIIQRDGHILIIQRPPQGLLGGLWEFPGGRRHAGENADQACIRKIKEKVALTVEIINYLTRIHHAYTHFRIVADVFQCRFLSGKISLSAHTDFRWITIDEIDNFPFHFANHKFIPLLKKHKLEL